MKDFAIESDYDLKSFFELEGVVYIHRLHRKVDGILIPSFILILTFNRPILADHICCGFCKFWVRQYVPNSFCCFKCQRFVHTQEHCMSQPIYMACGQKAHSPSQCQTSQRYVNCNGPHSSNSEARHRYQTQYLIDFCSSFTQISVVLQLDRHVGSQSSVYY